MEEIGGKGVDVDRMMEDFGKYLELLKENDPEEYKQLIAEMEQHRDGFSPQLPNGQIMSTTGIQNKIDAGIDVTPDPGFVVKTRDQDGKKIFINVCSSEHVGNFSVKKSLDEEGKEVEGVNIPLSLGAPRTDKDKSGLQCLVYDVILHPDVISDTKEDKSGSFRHFVIGFILDYIEQKHKILLDKQYKLPRMKQKGTLMAQRIRSSIPKIEDVSEQSRKPISKPASVKKSDNFNAQSNLKSKANKVHVNIEPQSINHILLCRSTPEEDEIPYVDGTFDLESPPYEIVLHAHLPRSKNGTDVKLEAANQYIVVRGDGCIDLELFLPFSIREPSISARFDQSRKLLVVSMPVKHINELNSVGPDPGSRQWLLREAITDGNAIEPKIHYTELPGNKDSPGPVQEDEELPEDRFHRQDLISRHFLAQRELSKQKELSEKNETSTQEKGKESEKELEQPENPSMAESKPNSPEKPKVHSNKMHEHGFMKEGEVLRVALSDGPNFADKLSQDKVESQLEMNKEDISEILTEKDLGKVETPQKKRNKRKKSKKTSVVNDDLLADGSPRPPGKKEEFANIPKYSKSEKEKNCMSASSDVHEIVEEKYQQRKRRGSILRQEGDPPPDPDKRVKWKDEEETQQRREANKQKKQDQKNARRLKAQLQEMRGKKKNERKSKVVESVDKDSIVTLSDDIALELLD